MFDGSSSRCKLVISVACVALTVVALEATRDPLFAQRSESTHSATPAHAERRSVRIGESSLGYVNVRQAPDINSRVIGKVRPGERYGSWRMRDGWVWLDEKQGWITERYVLVSSRSRDEPETAREPTAKRDPNQGATTAGLSNDPRRASRSAPVGDWWQRNFERFQIGLRRDCRNFVYSSSVQRSTGGMDWSTDAVVDASFDGCSLRVTESSIKAWSFGDMGGDSKLRNHSLSAGAASQRIRRARPT